MTQGSSNPADPTVPLPETGESASTPAALPAVEEAIGSEINEGARDAADEPLPEPAIPFPSRADIFPRSEASIRDLARRIGGNVPIDPMVGRDPTFEAYT